MAGLAFSLGGDILLMLPRDYFLPGLGSFLLAQVCYLFAFTADHRLTGKSTPFVFWALMGVLLLCFLWPGIDGSLRGPVVLYAGFLLAMAAQAGSRALTLKTPAAIAAALGATLFVISDSILAVRRFHGDVPYGHVLVLGTYFAAQWLIAFSVVCHRPGLHLQTPMPPGAS